MKKLAGSQLKKFNKAQKIERNIVFVLENLEYARNVASIFNLAYALKVEKIFLTGITTTPPFGKELRKVSREREDQIHWEKNKNANKVIDRLKKKDFTIISIAKTDSSKPIFTLSLKQSMKKVAIIVGNEKQGLANSLLLEADLVTYVPVFRPLAHLNITNELAVVAYSLV